MTQFQLRRVNLEALTQDVEDGYFHERWTHLGGDSRFLANVPNVFQALANPQGTHDFAQVPQWGSRHMALAYWESLLFLLVHSFGWRSPAHGLKWWHDAGRPCDDDRFALIEQTWLADGFLRWFEAWVQDWNFDAIARSEHFPGSYLVVSETEWQHLGRLQEDMELSLPLWGGWDSLHLTTHVRGNSGKTELVLDRDGGPRGVLFVEQIAGFREVLDRDATLQRDHPSGRSWRIDVICKQIGWLGTYRRSRVTGYWFAGKHSIHMAGHPAERAD